LEEVLEEEAALEAAKENAKKVQQQDEACSGKTCTANEHCCEGQVCVDTDESKLVLNQEYLSFYTPLDHSATAISN